jgi:hypothetical protein
MGETVLEMVIRTLKEGKAPTELANELEQLNSKMQNVGATTKETSDKFKESTESVDKHKGAMETVKDTYHEFQSKVATVQMAIGMVKGALDETVGAWVNYALEVDKGSKLTGMAVDEYSRFVQVADDVGISQQSINTALEAATRKGIPTNLEALGKLSDEYLRHNEGLDRSKFLMDNFGRSGTDLVRVMELGSAAIKEQSAAVDEGLVANEQAIKDAKEYALAMDALNDEVTIIKNSIGKDLVKALTEAATAMMTLYKWTDAVEGALKEHSTEVRKTTGNYADYKAEVERATQGTGYFITAEGDLVQFLGQGNSKLVEENYLLTETEWRTKNAAEAHAQFAKDADTATTAVTQLDTNGLMPLDISIQNVNTGFNDWARDLKNIETSTIPGMVGGLGDLTGAADSANTKLGDIKRTTADWKGLMEDMTRSKLIDKLLAGFGDDMVGEILKNLGLINRETEAWNNWITTVKNNTNLSKDEMKAALKEIYDKYVEITTTPWMIEIGVTLTIDPKDLEWMNELANMPDVTHKTINIDVNPKTTPTTTPPPYKKGGSGGEQENTVIDEMGFNSVEMPEITSETPFTPWTDEGPVTTYYPGENPIYRNLPTQEEIDLLAMSNGLYRGAGSMTRADLYNAIDQQKQSKTIIINNYITTQEMVNQVARKIAELMK